MKSKNNENARIRSGSIDCPQLLKRYIELINLLPNGLKILTPEEINPGISAEISQRGPNNIKQLQALRVWMEKVEEHYKILPGKAKTFLFRGKPKKPQTLQQARAFVSAFNGQPDEKGAQEMYSDYDSVAPLLLTAFLGWTFANQVKELRAVRSLLLDIANLNEGKRFSRILNQKGLFAINLGIPISVDITREGFLRMTEDNILEVLIREKVEVARIKQCPVCSKIFWAGRLNRKACSDKCVATNRQRNYRLRDKKQENEKKKKNRQFEKIRDGLTRKR
jgi:hypothetical protein